MNKLNASTLKIIQSHPTNTILTDNQNWNEDFRDILYSSPTNIEAPEQFDGKIIWKDFLSPVLNQGMCSSCWAYATTATLSDQFNIQSKGILHIQLSPTKLILCNWQGKEISLHQQTSAENNFDAINIDALEQVACTGNTLLDAWRYLYIFGTPTIQCIPADEKLGLISSFKPLSKYESIIDLPLCQNISGKFGDLCADNTTASEIGSEYGTPAQFYRAYNIYTIPNDEKIIRQEIFKWGPISSGMQLYADFYTFNSKQDIYIWDGKSPEISGHAIEITGWGIENNIPYWQVKNSWGKEWGNEGYFKILRGQNHCRIESNVIIGSPDFFLPNNIEFTGVKNNEVFEKLRKQEDTQIKGGDGGIDPTTGYSRRITLTRPEYELIAPIKQSQVTKDWDNFVAGNVRSKENQQNSPSLLSNKINWIVIFGFIIFLFFIFKKILYKHR